MVCIARGALAACIFMAAEPAWLPSDAIDRASIDLLTVPPESRPFQFYIWVRQPTDDKLDALAYALNAATSRALVPIRPHLVDNGRLIRLDLREWMPEPKHQANFRRIIAGYVDPNFYVPASGQGSAQQIALLQLTPGTVLTEWPPQVIERKAGGIVHVAIQPFAFDGRTVTRAATTRERLDRALQFQGVPAFGPALQATKLKSIETLVSGTQNTVPIVAGMRWLAFSMSTLDGGLYYDLQQYRGLNEQQWAALWGADFIDTIDTTEYIGRWRSDITGDPRRATFGIGRRIRQSQSYPLVVITQDIADGAFDPRRHPIYSLGEGFKWDAAEALSMRSNGFVAAALFDGEGKLQDAAPDAVANDRTTPEPHSTRLQPIISCLRCHGEFGFWRPMPNDVKTLLASPGLLQAFDVQARGDPLAYIKAKYSGDLTLALQYARDSHHAAVRQVTDGRGAVETMALVGKLYNEHVYGQITPAVAAAELGAIVEDDTEGLAVVRELLPGPPAGALEDPALLALKLFDKHPQLVVDRKTWEAQYQATLSRLLNR